MTSYSFEYEYIATRDIKIRSQFNSSCIYDVIKKVLFTFLAMNYIIIFGLFLSFTFISLFYIYFYKNKKHLRLYIMSGRGFVAEKSSKVM